MPMKVSSRSSTFSAALVSQAVLREGEGGREREREGGRERGREGGREGGRAGGREGKVI